MRWLKPLLLALPFALAAALNVLLWASDHYHWRILLITHYAFLFGTPWGHLLGELPIPNPRSHFLQLLLGYSLVLWVPAALYCACLWIALRIALGWVDLFRQRKNDSSVSGNKP